MSAEITGLTEAQRGTVDVDAVVTLPGLHPGQAIVDGLYADGARFVMLMCGRRWGKTKYGIRRAGIAALEGKEVGWFAPTYKYAAEAWRELVKRLGSAAVSVRMDDKRMEFANGGVIEVWTMDSEDPARGRKYDEVVIDEAGLQKNLRDVWFSAIRPTLADKRGLALFLGTPKGSSGSFTQMFTSALKAELGWRARRAETAENPWIPAEEIEAARLEMPAEIFDQEFRGIPADDGGNPFGLKAIADAVDPVLPLADAKVVAWGLDLARSGDFTVLCGLDAQCRVVRLERWQAPWLETRRRVYDTVGDVPVVADATGVGDAIVEDLQTMGVTVTGFKFTQSSKTLLMQRLVTAFQTRFLRIPAGWLVGELEMFGYTYTPNGVRYEAPQGLHDDGVMALGLAVYGWDRVVGAKPLAVEAGPMLRKADDAWLLEHGLMPDDGLPESSGQLPANW